MVVVITIITTNILGVLLFFFLKTRYKFPVYRVFISSFPPRGGGLSLRSQTAITDSEDDDHESGFRRYPAAHVNETLHDGDSSKTDTLMTDFKYSETKV